ncbi:MAG: hypothetical protein R6W83_02435 [Cryobacterium sp.]
MSFLTGALMSTVLAEVGHVELPLPMFVYPAVALVLFIALAGVLWSYRDVANRHSAKAEAYAKANGGGSTGAH